MGIFRTGFLLGILCGIAGSVPGYPESVAEQSPSASGNKHCIWEVKGKKNTLFFLGSIHFMNEEMFPLGYPIDSLLQKVHFAVFETDMRQGGSPEFGPWMQKEMSYQGDTTLEQALGEEMYDRVVQAAESLGADPIVWKRVKPWYVASVLPQMKLDKMGYRSSLGLDTVVLQRIQEKGMPIESLHSLKEHMKVYSRMEDEIEKAFLDYSLDRLSVLETSFPALCAAWKAGDIDTLARLRKEGIGSYEGLYRHLFLDKNERWLPRIEALLDRDKDVLVVLGFGHLVGKGNLIEMLNEKGFTVTQR